MKIIHKAILKELIQTFVIGFVALNFILMMEKILRLSRILSGVGASMFDMLNIILYIQPQLMLLSVPMALLLSILLTYGRINMDNELIILRSSGMSFRDIAAPAFIMGIACFLIGTLSSFHLGPLGAKKLREAITEIITHKAPLAIEEGVFNTIFRDTIILVREKPAIDEIRGIFIHDGRKKNEPKVLLAKEGRINVNEGYAVSLFLKDGFIYLIKGNTVTELFFGSYNLSLSLATETPNRKNSERGFFEILSEIRSSKDNGRIPLVLDLHRRLSLPSACLLLMFLGPPLSLIAGRTGRLGGLTIGLFVFALFYAMLIYGENLARSGKVPHFAGAWTPVIILALAAFLAFRKASRQ